MRNFLAATAGLVFNVAAGFYLLNVPTEQIPAVLYWMLIIAIPFLAILSIGTFGTLVLGWAGIMGKAPDSVPGWEPGEEQMIGLYEATINSLKGYSRTRMYASFASSVVLMAGIAAQGWLFILVLEILGSALGYGFINWVFNNVTDMHKRAYGSEES